MQKSNKIETIHVNVSSEKTEFSCFCQASTHPFLLTRCFGLLPIVTNKKKPHENECCFVVSLKWKVISGIILLLYLPYMFVMYGERFRCGPGMSNLNNLEWYVMSFGYILSDIESVLDIAINISFAKKLAKFFIQLSSLIDSKEIFIKLSLINKRSMLIVSFALTVVMISYSYVSYLRTNLDFGEYNCTLLDQPFAVIIRGLSSTFPTVELMLIVSITNLMMIKFKSISKATQEALQSCKVTGSTCELEKVARTHREVNCCVRKLNEYFGGQMLLGITSSLYATIYYLYRIATAKESARYTISNVQERIHYCISFIHRAGRLLVFMLLGHKLTSNAQKPLEALLDVNIFSYSTEIQAEIQLLLLIWQNHKASLSALKVVNIGPWLLAPIVGNVITYLLVALQFQSSTTSELPRNVTNLIEIIF